MKPDKQKIEQLLQLMIKFRKSSNPLIDGTSYAVGNWWYENYPDYPCTTPRMIEMGSEGKELTTQGIENILQMQAQVDCKEIGIPTIKEDINRINGIIYNLNSNPKDLAREYMV